jgi:hypothetical protein
MMMPVDQTLILETLLQRRAHIQGPYPLPPRERLAEETGTGRFPIVDELGKADGSGC